MPRKNLYLASFPLLVLVPSFLGATAAFGIPPKQQQQSPSELTFASTSSNSVLLAQSYEPSRSDESEHCRQEREIEQDIERDRQNLQNDENESDRRQDQRELNRDRKSLQDLYSEDSGRSYNCGYLYRGDRGDDRVYRGDRDYNRDDNYNRDLPPVVPAIPQPDSPARSYRDDNQEYNRSSNYDRNDNYNRKSPEIPDPWSDSRDQ